MKSKNLRAERFILVEEARRIADVDATRYNTLMAKVDELKLEIDRIDREEAREHRTLEALRARARGEAISLDHAADLQSAEDEAFGVWARRGEAALNEQQRAIFAKSFQAAQSTGTGSEGGYTVPQGFYDRVIDAQKAYGGLLDAGFVFDTSTGIGLPIPTSDDTENKGALLAENSPAAQQDVAFGQVMFGAFTYTSNLIKVSNELLQDSTFDLNSWLAAKLGIRIARATNEHFTTGDGSGKPLGVMGAIQLGATAADQTLVTYDEILDLEHSVDPANRKGASWMASDLMLASIKKIKDGAGRPLWLPGLEDKEPDTICGYPYTINQDMDAPGAGAKPLVFGDLSKYFVRRIAGVRVLRLAELYSASNQIGFVAFQRWDGSMVDAGTHPVKYMQMAA